jgi:hypothetical protein
MKCFENTLTTKRMCVTSPRSIVVALEPPGFQMFPCRYKSKKLPHWHTNGKELKIDNRARTTDDKVFSFFLPLEILLARSKAHRCLTMQCNSMPLLEDCLMDKGSVTAGFDAPPSNNNKSIVRTTWTRPKRKTIGPLVAIPRHPPKVPFHSFVPPTNEEEEPKSFPIMIRALAMSSTEKTKHR